MSKHGLDQFADESKQTSDAAEKLRNISKFYQDSDSNSLMLIPTASISYNLQSDKNPGSLHQESINSTSDNQQVVKSNANSNQDCITRDAKNVFDKKMERFNRIQRMRGNSQHSTV